MLSSLGWQQSFAFGASASACRYAHSRPDEVATAGPAVACLVGNCRPPDFYYPSLFIYSLAGLYFAFYAVTRPLGWYSSVTAFADSRRETLGPFFYLGRGLSALMGTLTVWWLYVLGRTLFDRTVGLVAALFLSMSLLHVRDSHFSTTDITMTALIGASRADHCPLGTGGHAA